MALLDKIKVLVVGTLGAMLLRALAASLRWRFEGLACNPHFFSELDRPGIFVFWHNRQLIMAPMYRMRGGKRAGLATLISLHRDGRYIALATRVLGCSSIAGSSSRGGSTALRKMARALRRGVHCAITPDGPRGPIYKAKSGAVQLARISACRIYPISYSASSCWQLRSWDRMIIPKPFSRVRLIIGEGLQFDDSGSIEEQTAELEQALLALESALGLPTSI